MSLRTNNKTETAYVRFRTSLPEVALRKSARREHEKNEKYEYGAHVSQ